MNGQQTNPTSSRRPTPWSESLLTWKQRVGYYLIGLTVSCVLLGFFYSYVSKVREQARREEEIRNAGKPLPVPGVPLNPEK